MTAFILPGVIGQLTQKEVTMLEGQGLNFSSMHGMWHVKAPWSLGHDPTDVNSHSVSIPKDPYSFREPSCLPSGKCSVLLLYK